MLPDADVLGVSAATFVAGAVTAVGMFRLDLPFFDVAWRAGLTFVVTYVAVFCLVKYLVWTMLTEMASARRLELEKRARAIQEAQEAQEAPATQPVAVQEAGESE